MNADQPAAALADARRRRALADIEAALHHLSLASEALYRALDNVPIVDIFADEVSSEDILRRSFLRAATNRLRTVQMHTRKAKEGKR